MTPLSRRERLRLWLSYQRYAFLLIGGGLALVAAVVAWRPHAWWLWGPAVLLVAKPIGFGVVVWRRWPKKLRATIVGLRRIEAGRFRPDSLRAYCGDPCFRVVAREILRRAGVPPAERRTIMKRLTAEKRKQDDTLVLVDSTGVVTVDGNTITRSP